MKAVKRAKLIYPDKREQEFLLMQVEPKVFKWISAAGREWNGVQYPDEPIAIKALRVDIETDPAMAGVDLTLFPIAPPAEERAAARIVNLLYAEFVPASAIPYDIEKVARIIREDTQIDKLIEHVNLLLVYEFKTMRRGKPPGLDMVMGGLMLSVIEDLEKATSQDLSNLKQMLTADINQVKTYSSLPAGIKQ